MAKKQAEAVPHSTAADTTTAVDEFMLKLEHPHKALIEAIRSTITGASSAISEGVKWNAPSFRTTEYFATTNLREKAGVGLILHLGAKVREAGPGGLSIQDPEGLLRWLAKDRAMVVFRDMSDFITKKSAFASVIQQWITHV